MDRVCFDCNERNRKFPYWLHNDMPTNPLVKIFRKYEGNWFLVSPFLKKSLCRASKTESYNRYNYIWHQTISYEKCHYHKENNKH